MATELGQLFSSTAERYPRHSALHIAGTNYSYQEVLQRSTEIANQLINLAAEQVAEVRCALAIDKTIDGYSALIATQLAKQTWIPLNASFPLERNQAILQQALPQLLVLTAAYQAQAEQLVAELAVGSGVVLLGWEYLPEWATEHTVLLTAEQLAQSTAQLQQVERDCRLAYVMFTSGSTGAPKGVAVTQQNVLAYLQRIEQLYQPNCDDRFSQFFEFTFDLSVHDLFVCWQAGGCLYPAGLADNLMPTAYVRRHRLTFWFSVPTMAASLHSLGQLKADSLPSLRYVLFCGEALPHSVAAGFQQAASAAQLDNLYGPTEATIAFSYLRFDAKVEVSSSVLGIGKPMAGLQMVVVDDNNQQCAVGEKGELLLGGDQLADGYWQRDELTAKQFVSLSFSGIDCQRWYRSGDLAALNAAGEIDFFGRIDNQVKIRGYRIELQEIEQVLLSLEGVTHAVALAVYPSDSIADSADSIRCFVVSSQFDQQELMAYCNQQLPEYMRPSELELVDKMPTNASGKIDRKQLAGSA